MYEAEYQDWPQDNDEFNRELLVLASQSEWCEAWLEEEWCFCGECGDFRSYCDGKYDSVQLHQNRRIEAEEIKRKDYPENRHRKARSNRGKAFNY